MTVVTGRGNNLEVDMAGDNSFVILGLAKGSFNVLLHIKMK